MSEKKVLLVDEEDTILNTYSFLLSKEGYGTVATNSGSEALETLKRQSFDVVIIDLAVKNGNGQTVLENIRELFPLIPVIALTNNISDVVRQLASLLGACALIQKPCSYETLISSIRRSFFSNRRYH